MSTTYTLDTSTSRAHPTPSPMRRLAAPHISKRKDGEPVVMLTAYTARYAQILDEHCDMLLVGDSLGQVIYGLPSTLHVTLDMMIAHGAAVVRGSMHACVIVDMPFATYEESPEQAYRNAARVLAETGAQGVKLEGGAAMAPTIKFLVDRGIPVVGHIGLMPQQINRLGSYRARGQGNEEWAQILEDAKAVDEAGAFAMVVEGVVEPLAAEVSKSVRTVTIGIGASDQCDGQVLVTEDMLGLFERTPRFVKRYETLADRISAAVGTYAEEVKSRTFPSDDYIYPKKK
ncbi:MAG: 3-methyl-2-oxobutanoate hydroxymethyltransferase [Sphingomonadales bacterium]